MRDIEEAVSLNVGQIIFHKATKSRLNPHPGHLRIHALLETQKQLLKEGLGLEGMALPITLLHSLCAHEKDVLHPHGGHCDQNPSQDRGAGKSQHKCDR